MGVQMILPLVMLGLTYVPYIGCLLLFGWWLYRHWKISGERAYFFLLMGIVVIPVLQLPLTALWAILATVAVNSMNLAPRTWGDIVGLMGLLCFIWKYSYILKATSMFADGTTREHSRSS